MARAYSDDLRRKLIEAHEAGEGGLVKLAARFRVSVSWAKRVAAQYSRTQTVERPRGGKRGPASKLTPEIQKQIGEWIRQQPDLTLAEIQSRLWKQRKLYSSLSRLWEVLGEMGLRLKKSRSTPPNKTRAIHSSGGSNGAAKSARSIPRS